MFHTLALWGLVTNYGEGGYKMAGGGGEGQANFYPYKKGGGGKSFSCAEVGGGGTKSFEVILIWDLEVLAIVMGGAQKVSTPDFLIL